MNCFGPARRIPTGCMDWQRCRRENRKRPRRRWREPPRSCNSEGLFDAYPGLTLVSGHWGELNPYFLDRLDETLPQKVTGLDHEISYYYKKNIYVTPSGMFYSAPMKLCVERLGADRILWSTDYPYMLRENSLEFLQSMELEPSEREAIGHGNAEKIYHI